VFRLSPYISWQFRIYFSKSQRWVIDKCLRLNGSRVCDKSTVIRVRPLSDAITEVFWRARRVQSLVTIASDEKLDVKLIKCLSQSLSRVKISLGLVLRLLGTTALAIVSLIRWSRPLNRRKPSPCCVKIACYYYSTPYSTLRSPQNLPTRDIEAPVRGSGLNILINVPDR
jgi:hypothetical protein